MAKPRNRASAETSELPAAIEGDIDKLRRSDKKKDPETAKAEAERIRAEIDKK